MIYFKNRNKYNCLKGIIEQLQFVYESYDMDILAIGENPRYSFSVLESLETVGYVRTKEKMNEDSNQQDEQFWTDFVSKNDTFYTMDLSDYFKNDGLYDPIIGNVRV